MRGRPIWTNIDNTDNRHTLKRLQDPARYGQRGQPKTDTPPPRVHIPARNGGFLRRNGRFYSRNSGFLRQKAPFMQQEAKASTTRETPRHMQTPPPRSCGALHAPRVCIYNRTEKPKASTPPEYGQRGQYGQPNTDTPAAVCPYLPRCVSISTKDTKATTRPE